MNNLKPHPLTKDNPQLEGEAWALFLADIKRHGVNEPGMLYEGMILDGTQRYRATLELKIDMKWEEWKSVGQTPIEFIVSQNLRRRHLSIAQRSAMAAEEAIVVGVERRANQNKNVGKKVDQKLHATAEMAKKYGICELSVSHAVTVKRTAPEIFEDLKRDEITINAAWQIIKQKGLVRPTYSPRRSEEKLKMSLQAREVMAEATPLETVIGDMVAEGWRYESLYDVNRGHQFRFFGKNGITACGCWRYQYADKNLRLAVINAKEAVAGS